MMWLMSLDSFEAPDKSVYFEYYSYFSTKSYVVGN